jgi:hypothetical protein
VVLIFAKTPDENLAMLVKKIETMAAAQQDAKLAVVLNFIGPPTDETTDKPDKPTGSSADDTKKTKKVAAVSTGSKAKIKKTSSPEDDLKERIKKFDLKHRFKSTPLTLTTEVEAFKLNNQAEVTVMIYKGKKVRSNYASASALDQKTTAAILADVKKLLLEPPEKPKDDSKTKPKTSAKTK